MKRCLALVMCGLLASCAESVVTTVPVSEPTYGWRPAGLEAPDQGYGDTQWVQLVTSGSRLIAMNTVGGLHISTSYSGGWSRLPWSMAGTPFFLHADNDSVWIGTEKPARLYSAKQGEWRWKDLKFPGADTAKVTVIGHLKGHLIAVGQKYPLDDIFLFQDGAWTNWGSGQSRSAPYRLFDVGDTLWSATWEDGLWFRVWGEASWKRMPSPEITWMKPGSFGNDTAFHPRGLAWYKGSLWTGDWIGETTEMPGGKAPYHAVRNCPPTSVDGTCLRDLPVNILAMTAWKDRLFVAGFFGASGHVYDDSSRQWIPLEDTWCWDNGKICGGTRTRDMVGLGDTLYAATNRFIMKYPMNELPKLTAAMAAKYHWPTDTSWRSKYLNVPNPKSGVSAP